MKKAFVFAWVALCAVACSAATGGPESDEPVGQNEGEASQFCGGIAGIPCPAGYKCVDDPSDSCDPKKGGADCGGICRRSKPAKCNYADPSKTWVSKDATACMTIRYFCAEGTMFSDECGCGCQLGEPCGAKTCGAGQVCCNASCGICTEPGGFCTQQVCEPAPL